MIDVRVAVVAAIVVVTLVVGLVARRGVVVRRRRFSMPDHPPGLEVFVSKGCGSCAAVLAMLHDLEADVEVVTFEADPAEFRRHGLDGVPAIVRISPDGRGWAAVGIPSARRLRRWLGAEHGLPGP
jgi:hypothetical protein